MKKTFCICILCILTSDLLSKEPVRTFEGTVTHVSDGDTIHAVDGNGTKVKIRLYGIDAPETEKSNKQTGKISKPGQPWGLEAWKALEKKVHRMKIRIDVMDSDKYKRLVCMIWLGSRNINREMISEGHAWAYKKYLDKSPYASEFIKEEEVARKAGKGLWKEPNPLPPWEFRKAPEGE